MLAGESYNCLDADLLTRWHKAKALTQEYNYHTLTTDSANQLRLLDELLGSYGECVCVAPPFHVDYGENIHLGKHCEINMGCVFLDCNRIDVGNNTGFGPGVHIYTVFHPVDPTERLQNKRGAWSSLTAPVKIGNNVWVGGGSIILAGVTIGDNTTIGAGSLVTKSIPANCLAYGNPCRVVRQL